MRSLGSPGGVIGTSPRRPEDGFSEPSTLTGRDERGLEAMMVSDTGRDDEQALEKLGQQQQSRRHGLGAGGGAAPVELVQASSAFDLASLVLYGAQAIPVRLKILLDRLLSVLPHDDVLHVLHGFGWTYEDYVRGYILQDSNGTSLERWAMASREEEPLILQQFLRFGETRALAHYFIATESERAAAEHRESLALHGESDIKKFIERSNRVSASSSSSAVYASSKSGPIFTNAGTTESIVGSRGGSGGVVITRSSQGLRHHHTPSSTHSVSPPAPGTSPVSSPITSVSSSPLNRLQSMQPYDFRHQQVERRNSSPDNLRSTGEGLRASDIALMHNQNNNNNTTPASSPTNNMSGAFLNHSSDLSLTDGMSDEDTMDGGAINLTLGSAPGSLDSVFAARKVKHLRKSANPMKRRWNPMVLSTLTTNPATGKRRVQCHVCLKTFCDKGALKIHFSAVHLREMHKCTVEGCNMMFSSRRSRNRHSANPNPKLHTPNLRRKISPHDGRTANPFPLLPPSTLLNFNSSNNNAAAAGLISPGALTSSLHEKISSIQEKMLQEKMLHEKMIPLCPTPPTPVASTPHGDGVLSLTKKPDEKTDNRREERKHTSSPERGERCVNLSIDKESKNGENKASLTTSGGLNFSLNKGVRKRKALNPTRCAAIISDDDLRDASSDDSSSNTYIDQNGLMEESKSDYDDDVDDITTDGQDDDSKDFDVDDDLDDKDTDDRMSSSPLTSDPQPPTRIKSEREAPKWSFEVEQKTVGLAAGKEDDKKLSLSDEPSKKRQAVENLSTKKEDGKASPPCLTRVKTEDMAENPLRHLESLSLGAFAGLVPTAPRSISTSGGGVSFHAPGLGLADIPKEATAIINNNNIQDSVLLGRDSPPSDHQMSSLLPVYRDAALVGSVEIPVDKENPRRCTACGKVFQNHFGVKTHYQNVHLKLMHKCTVEGCNAAFPSKRSRDRHSANLNLHRKLLSTSSEKGGAPGAPFLDKSLFPYPPSDFFSRLYDPQGLPLNLADVYHRLPTGPEGFVLPPAFSIPPFHHHQPHGGLLAPPTSADPGPSSGTDGGGSRGSPASAASSSPGPHSPGDHIEDEDDEDEDHKDADLPSPKSPPRRASSVEDTPVPVAAT
ncbi:zinc finger protein basonuclin-2-like isoform X2 [Ornithodoros turicata]|uniref:zinc finger protein basonuclin-2-like isoform X2 n=1 Tax=Ornithodoros turicata TaxID=34597 RepID=UPI00313A0A9C